MGDTKRYLPGGQVPYCPTCGKKIDALSAAGNDATPAPGDYLICLYCLTVLQFDEDLILRITEDLSPEVLALRERLRRHKARLN